MSRPSRATRATPFRKVSHRYIGRFGPEPVGAPDPVDISGAPERQLNADARFVLVVDRYIEQSQRGEGLA